MGSLSLSIALKMPLDTLLDKRFGRGKLSPVVDEHSSQRCRPKG
jgi:hypothetical protein